MATAETTKGLTIKAAFDVTGAPKLAWKTGSATVKESSGKIVFNQDHVVFPEAFSQQAIDVVASKYFFGPSTNGGPTDKGREYSFQQLVARICNPLTGWGEADNYFDGRVAADAFHYDLCWLLFNQFGAFNSPVQFNCGLFTTYGTLGSTAAYRWDEELQRVVPLNDGEAYKYPQLSACFIISVADDMQSIAERGKREMMLFKAGSGCGTNNSTIRSRREFLSGGGRPSGPLSFMEIYDAIGATTKSGGVARRAAKMEILRCDHPDVMEFIRCKAVEEKKARALIAAGYAADFNPGGAYSEVRYQNANLSVRVTNEFMESATSMVDGELWQTLAVTTGTAKNTRGEEMPAYDASEMLDEIAQAAWVCGDPGLQYESMIQKWHTCPNTAPIRASNPCSEYMFIDDSACNLASLNLMKFRRDLPDVTQDFDITKFCNAVRLFIIAQDIMVDNASYPSPEIAENSHRFRPLGLGYANLGALIMSWGLPYDGDAARALCGLLTAILTGKAYATSAELASVVGPFEGFAVNREPMLRVMRQHTHAVEAVVIPSGLPWDLNAMLLHLKSAAVGIWFNVLYEGDKHGFRNSQVSVMAPCGTIGFMMDCDTTGIEPELALVKYKKLAGGGSMKIVNQTVPLALKMLGYSTEKDSNAVLAAGADDVSEMVEYIAQHGTLEGCDLLKPEHLPVFDCSFPTTPEGRSIHWTGHVRMVAAAQPFLSGAVSKTINMPSHSTPDDIRAAYIMGWKLGLKAIAVYRDGSKGVQPLSTTKDKKEPNVQQLLPDHAEEFQRGIQAGLAGGDYRGVEMKVADAMAQPYRRKMPKTCKAERHGFEIAGHKGYLHVGFYEDGKVGEIFLTGPKEGSTVSGLMDVVATITSIALQYGVPLESLVHKLSFATFEPRGFTGDPDVPLTTSITDFVFRKLAALYLNKPTGDENARVNNNSEERSAAQPNAGGASSKLTFELDAPSCGNCGSIMVRAGACFRCLNCGENSGCG